MTRQDDADDFGQRHDRVRLEWGWRGCRDAAARRDIVVIVDVLRFSTAVVSAAARRVQIIPVSDLDDIDAMQREHGALAIADGLVPGRYQSIDPGSRIAVRSPNGATCVRRASAAPLVLIGAIVNATAIASHVREAMARHQAATTVIACGERWSDPSDDGTLRFAIEDYLGAGAILHRLRDGLSAEAQLCAAAFEASRNRLLPLLLGCGSGRELVRRNDRGSVELAAMLDRYDVVPALRGDVIACVERIEHAVPIEPGPPIETGGAPPS